MADGDGQHHYEGDGWHTVDCSYRCGAWAGPSRSGGPDRSPPETGGFGSCPMNQPYSKAVEETLDGMLAHITSHTNQILRPGTSYRFDKNVLRDFLAALWEQGRASESADRPVLGAIGSE